MKGLSGFFAKAWVVQALGLVLLALLIWFAGPLVGIAGHLPLESAGSRGVAIALLVLSWLLYRLVKLLLSNRKDGQLMGELSAGEAGRSAVDEAAAEQVDTVRQGFEEALAVLRKSGSVGKKGKPCLYELPWYVIIGAPGSGKTTALVNSGLKFPLAERMGQGAVKGVGGTRNCDWWFTDEAVLLDTAGRWSTQDSHREVDAAAWQSFLGLVKKYRPRRPLNGVFLTLSLADLMQQGEEERNRHAKAMRDRLSELTQSLGVRVPVYMLLTKGDLVAGFTDFFADLNQEGRDQVWGETFPKEDAGRPFDCLAQFDAAYGELLQRLNTRTVHRIQQERDIQRRGAIMDFPQQMALLRPGLMAFLQTVFAPNRYEQPALLRGVYFTSGTQEGTPIDRVMGLLAGTFRLDRQAGPIYSGKGKSFFLTRLLKEVVFGEAELAGADPRVERREKLFHFGGLGVSAALVVAMGVLWGFSYLANKAAIARTEEEIARYRTVEAAPQDSRANFKLLLSKLEAMAGVGRIWQDAGWIAHFGLFQGYKLQAGADEVYEQLLRDYLLPSIVGRLQERLQVQPEFLLLKAYLMLGHTDKLDAKFVEAVVRADWERMFNAEPETLGKLTGHLQKLLALKLRPIQLNDGLVAELRGKLAQVSPEQQCYDSFVAETAVDRSHDFKLVEALKPSGQKVFVLPEGQEKYAAVPGLFTAWGYGEVFLKKNLLYVKSCMEQGWVLDQVASSSDPREIERFQEKFKLVYLRDYQQYWSGVLDAVKLRPAQNIGQTVDLLDLLSRPESPLRLLLLAVEKNTSLMKISAASADLLSLGAGKAGLNLSDDNRKMIDAAKLSAGVGSGASGDPVSRLEMYFQDFNNLVGGGPDKPLPLDAVIAKTKELRDYFMQTGGGAGQKKPAEGVDVVGPARLEFSRLPEPVRSWLMSLANAGDSLIRSEVKGEMKLKLNENLKMAGIAGGGGGSPAAGGGKGGGAPSVCKLAFAGRYPFVRDSQQDAPIADFVKFFAPNGLLEQFFKSNLKDLVDTSSAQWRQKAHDADSPSLSQPAIHEFQSAAKIRDAFFASGNPSPQFQFDMKLVELGALAESFRLNMEGQEINFPRGSGQVVRVQWPGPSAGSGVRLQFVKPENAQVSRAKEGPWALFRLIDESSVQRYPGQDRIGVTFEAEGLTARFELQAASVNNPFSLGEARSFRCPESL